MVLLSTWRYFVRLTLFTENKVIFLNISMYSFNDHEAYFNIHFQFLVIVCITFEELLTLSHFWSSLTME